jgi:predicted dienelactone hydrolase
MTMFYTSLTAGVLFAIVSMSAAVAADEAAPYHVGETARLFHPPMARHWRGAKTEGLVTRIWYPTDPDVPEAAHDIGPPGDPIMRGHPIAVDAPLSPAHENYPLLLLSHGTGGSADSLDWLGAAFAAAGYVVVGVNHPGNTALEPLTREGFMLWWERALDSSEALDAVLVDPKLGSHIDRDRIGAIGFSLGGYTVLELAGARTNLQAFTDFCHSPAADAICHPPEMDRLNGAEPLPSELSPETKASLAGAGESYRDKRIKAAFVISTALGKAFDAASFAEIDIPVALIGGTADVTAPVETNVKRIAQFLPKASLTLLPGAAHYTFLNVCVPAAVERLARLCKDNPGVDRDAVHAQTLEVARAFFAEALRGNGVSQGKTE